MIVLHIISANLYGLEEIVSKGFDKNSKKHRNVVCIQTSLLLDGVPVEKQNFIKTDTLTKLLTGLLKFCFSVCNEVTGDT